MTFFSQISSYKHIERLHIGTLVSDEGYADETDQHLGDTLAKAFSSRNNHYGCLASLRQLTLSGNVLSRSLYEEISKVVSFSQLTHLTLWGSQHAMEFASALVRGLSSDKLQLKHLGLSMYTDGTKKKGFRKLLRRCTELKSMCLEWVDWNTRAFECLMRDLQIIGQQLVLLSVHFTYDDIEDEDDDFDSYDPLINQEIETGRLEMICLACPNLEQFGYKVSDSFLKEMFETKNYAPLVGLHLPQVQVLYLTISSCPYTGYPSYAPSISVNLISTTGQTTTNR